MAHNNASTTATTRAQIIKKKVHKEKKETQATITNPHAGQPSD